jgi:hypothetical protein
MGGENVKSIYHMEDFLWNLMTVSKAAKEIDFLKL